MSIRTEVEKLIELVGDEALTAPGLVEAARDAEGYPLLNAHIWQVPEAELLQEARESRAHRLLIRIRVTSEEGITTRLMIHTREVPGYQTIGVVARTPDLASSKMAMLRADIARARDRLRTYSFVLAADMVAEVDEALQRAERRLGPEGDQAAA